MPCKTCKSMTQKEIIVEHAMKMFVAQGIKAVRMDDIAQELSVSKRTLYELFGDKEELLYQSMVLYSTMSKERRMQQIAQLDNPLEIMVMAIRDMIESAPTVGRMIRNMKRFYPRVVERLNGHDIGEVCNLRGWIKNCVERGYMTTTSDCDFVANIIAKSVYGIMLPDSVETHNSVELVSAISYSLIIFIRGLCTIEGIEVFDRSFGKYFSNIPSPDALTGEVL